MDKEYSPISGDANFCTRSITLALGDNNQAVTNKQVSPKFIFQYKRYIFISQHSGIIIFYIFYFVYQNATVQGISGTGSLCIGAFFLNKFFPGNKEIYLPTPSWGNHTPLFKMAGLSVKSYRYYDPKTCGLDFQGVLDDISVNPLFINFIIT